MSTQKSIHPWTDPLTNFLTGCSRIRPAAVLISTLLVTTNAALVKGTIMYPPGNTLAAEVQQVKFLAKSKPFAPTAVLPPFLKKRNRLFKKMPSSFEVLQFILNILKILGHCPFNYDVDGGVEAYSFSWSSFGTIQSLVAAFTASFCWFVFLTHHGLKHFLIFTPEYDLILLNALL